MLAYYLLIGIPFLTSGLISYSYSLKKKADSTIIRNNSNIEIVLFFIILMVMLSLRDITCGIDLFNYNFLYVHTAKHSWSRVFTAGGIEYGFVFLEKLASVLGLNFQTFLAFLAIVSLAPICFFYKKEAEIPMLTMALFLTIFPFSIYFSGLRQALAVAFVVPAWYLTKHKKSVWFLAVVLLAYLIHSSSLIMLLLYPIYHIKITKKRLIWSVPFIAAVFIFNRPIFSFLMRFIGTRYDRYSTTLSTGAYTMLILIGIFLAFAFVIPDEEQMDEDMRGWRNLLVVIFIIQCFAPIHNFAMRMNYYFLILMPVFLPKLIVRCNARFRQIALLSKWVMIVFFTLYFFYNAFMGADSLHIYPYVPFWA